MTFRSRIGIVAAVAAIVASSAAFTTGASAHPGHPGVASDDPVVLFNETFEDGLGDGEIAHLGDYKGSSYDADGAWLDDAAGNGLLVDGHVSDADLQDTTKGNFTSGDATADQDLRDLAQKIGTLNGTSPAGDNHVVSAYTNANPGADKVEFKTKNPLALSSKGRFLTISANIGAINCYAAHPKINFFLVDDGGTEQPVNNSALDGCGSSTGAPATATHLTGGRAVLFQSTSVGVVMRNAEGSGGGNDHAFDDIRVLDATPQLDKVFQTPGPLQLGATTNLVLTVTNTSELAAKPGWSFTDHLPSGLTVAGTPTSTCDATVTAGAGATNIVVTAGNLAQGKVSCAITVPVTSLTADGTFTNSASNIESVGLNAPGTTQVQYLAPPKAKCGKHKHHNKHGKCVKDKKKDNDDNKDHDGKKLPSTGAPWWVDPWFAGLGALVMVGGAAAFDVVRRRQTATGSN